MSHGHAKDVCEYGTVHRQCRCIGEYDPKLKKYVKRTNQITCPTPGQCIVTQQKRTLESIGWE